MKRLIYFLTLTAIFTAYAKIGLQLDFGIIATSFLLVGIIAGSFGLKRSFYFFLLVFPAINSIPGFMGSPYPYNYTPPVLFLLSGIFLSHVLNIKFTWVLMPNAEERENLGSMDWDFRYYHFFLVILTISAVFLVLRWSNITLGNMSAIGADTPVSPPLPRPIPGGGLQWHDQRVNFATIFPVLTVFLYFITPYIYHLYKRINPSEVWVFKTVSLGFYISAIFAVIQRVLGKSNLSDRLDKKLSQFNGLSSDFNALGVFAGIMFLWSTYEIKKKNSLGYMTFVASLIAGILSGSRTMFFFAAAGMFNLGLGFFKGGERKQKVVAIVLIGVFVVLMVIGGGTLKKRLMGADWDPKVSLFDKVDAALNGRLKMAAFSLRAIGDYLVPGLGTGNYTFYLAYKNYVSAKNTGKAYLYDLPLNQYLWVFVENGIFAFLAFSYFMVQLFRRSTKKLLTGTMLLALLFNTYFWLPEALVLFWVVTAVSTGPPKTGRFDPFLLLNKRGRIFKGFSFGGVVGVAIVIIFAAWNIVSLTKLHPRTWAQNTGTRYDYGMWPRENDFKGNPLPWKWSQKEAGIYVKCDSRGYSRGFKIECGAPLGRLKDGNQRLNISWNGKGYRNIELMEYDGELNGKKVTVVNLHKIGKKERLEKLVFYSNRSIVFRVSAAPGEEGFITFSVIGMFNPKACGLGNDNRDLGFRIYE